MHHKNHCSKDFFFKNIVVFSMTFVFIPTLILFSNFEQKCASCSYKKRVYLFLRYEILKAKLTDVLRFIESCWYFPIDCC